MRIPTVITSLALVAALAVPAAASASPEPAGPGQLSTGPSCAVKCITTALISPHTGAFGFTVRTDTPARIFIGVSKLIAPEGSWIDSAQSGPGRTSWSNHLTGLKPDTLYKVTVSATDSQWRTERRTTFYRTRAVQTNLPVGPGGVQSHVGCTVQCISKLHMAPEGTGLGLSVDTTVPAKTTLSVDRDAPGTIGGVPVFGTPEATTSGAAYAKRWSGFVKDLVPGTTYNFIVRATDANGNFSFRTGLFHTKERRAKLVIDGIRMYYDGDKGANRGELRFFVDVNQKDELSLHRKEKKFASGNWVELPNNGTAHFMPQSRGFNVAVQARERDHAPTCYDSTGTFRTPDSGKTDGWCNKWTWVTARQVIDLDTPVPGSGLPAIMGGTGKHDLVISTSNNAGIRFVAYGHVEVRYS